MDNQKINKWKTKFKERVKGAYNPKTVWVKHDPPKKAKQIVRDSLDYVAGNGRYGYSATYGNDDTSSMVVVVGKSDGKPYMKKLKRHGNKDTSQFMGIVVSKNKKCCNSIFNIYEGFTPKKVSKSRKSKKRGPRRRTRKNMAKKYRVMKGI